MSVGTYDFKPIVQNETWRRTITYKDPSGNPINLTGYTAVMHVRESYQAPAAALTLDTTNGGITLGGAAGTIALVMTATQTAALKALDAAGTRDSLYELDLIAPSGDRVPLMTGRLPVMRRLVR